ncbi:MAG: tetratricopeptide repeat protein [Cyclobacteriaceae bacterium]
MLRKIFLLISIVIQSVPVFGNQTDSLREVINFESNDSIKAFLYVQLSYQYLTNMELDSCIASARRGVLLSKRSHNETAMVLNYEFEGQYFYYLGLYKQSIEVFTETLRQGEKIQRHDIVVRAYSMLGWIFIEQRRFKDALKAFQKSITICRQQKIVGEDLALNYYGLGSVYSYRHSDIQDYKLGESYYDSALSVKNGLQIREKVYVLGELGSLYRDGVNGIDKSMQLLHEAEKLIRNNENHRDTYAYIISEIAFNNVVLHDYETSRYFAHKAVAIYDQLPFNRKMTSVYELLADVFSQLGDAKQAFRMEHLNRVLSDSIFGQRNIKLVEEINAQYEAEKKEKEIHSLTQTNLINKLNLKNSQNIVAIIGGASALVLILLSLNFYNRSRYQRRIREAEINQGVHEEKQRIAQDLHDNIGTQLTSISMRLNQLTDNPEIEHSKIRSLHEHTNALITELRDTLWVINKNTITLQEVADKISSMVWRMNQYDSGIELELTTEGIIADLKIVPVQASNLFRIAQEAISNSLKHSKATKIEITLKNKPEEIELSVCDNGVGFDTSQAAMHEHYGIANIKRRALEMSGYITINSQRNEGTKIVVRMMPPNQKPKPENFRPPTS